ncbi:MAG: energy transducer TonB [Gammaproteobacteria bacterium]
MNAILTEAFRLLAQHPEQIHPRPASKRWQNELWIIQLNRDERKVNLTMIFVILAGVGLMHMFGVKYFYWPGPLENTHPTPMRMEVSTIAMPMDKEHIVPKQTEPTPPQPKQPRKKIQPKLKLKKHKLSTDGIAISPEDQVLLQQMLRDFDMRQFAITKPDHSTEVQNQAFTEAYLDAAYDRNPKPEYPSIARSHGWQGKVILRVQISEKGKVESVTIEKSSSYEILDDSAIEAVKGWLFLPAMRGDKPISTSVLVPIIFSLTGSEFA